MKKKVITKLCMSPRTHATTKQGKEKKTMPYKWAWQGKVQLKIKMSIVQFSTNHSLQSLAMNIRHLFRYSAIIPLFFILRFTSSHAARTGISAWHVGVQAFKE